MLRCIVFGLDADFDTEVIDCIVWDFGGANRMLCIGRFGSDAPNYVEEDYVSFLYDKVSRDAKQENNLLLMPSNCSYALDSLNIKR